MNMKFLLKIFAFLEIICQISANNANILENQALIHNHNETSWLMTKIPENQHDLLMQLQSDTTIGNIQVKFLYTLT